MSSGTVCNQWLKGGVDLLVEYELKQGVIGQRLIEKESAENTCFYLAAPLWSA